MSHLARSCLLKMLQQLENMNHLSRVLDGLSLGHFLWQVKQKSHEFSGQMLSVFEIEGLDLFAS